MPKQRAHLVVLAFGLAACDPRPGPFAKDLPQGALLLSGTETVVFGLRVTGKTDVKDVVFVNGGLQTVELRDVRIEHVISSAFQFEAMVPDFPNEKEIAPREAAGFRVRFTSPGRGVHISRLIVESNSGTLEVELVGPGANDPLPALPDMVRFETGTNIRDHAGYDVPVGLARFFNLGGNTLVISEYRLEDAGTDFVILPGTPIPSVPCDPNGACIPESGERQGCCELVCRGFCDGGGWPEQACQCSLAMADAGECLLPATPCPGELVTDPNVECLDIACEPVRVVSGDYVVVPVAATPSASNTYDIRLRAMSNAGNAAVLISSSL